MADFLTDIIDENRLNDCNSLLEQAEIIIGKSIISLVNTYTKELDSVMTAMHKRVSNEKYEITDNELEKLIIRLPILIYEINDILMNVGIKEDLSKVIKQDSYNRLYVIQEGTIADKKSATELLVKEEMLTESVWKRSVKVISQKIDIANELLSSCKKILSKRIATQELINRLK